MMQGKPPHEQLTYLWLVLYGHTGSNGLHGTVKSQGESIKALEATTRRHDALEAQILFIARALQWIALAVMTTIGLLASGPLGDIARKVLEVAK